MFDIVPELLANLAGFIAPVLIVLVGVFVVKRKYGADAPVWAYLLVFGLAAVSLLFAPYLIAAIG
jgi:hypothetical protein